MAEVTKLPFFDKRHRKSLQGSVIDEKHFHSLSNVVTK